MFANCTKPNRSQWYTVSFFKCCNIQGPKPSQLWKFFGEEQVIGDFLEMISTLLSSSCTNLAEIKVIAFYYSYCTCCQRIGDLVSTIISSSSNNNHNNNRKDKGSSRHRINFTMELHAPWWSHPPGESWNMFCHGRFRTLLSSLKTTLTSFSLYIDTLKPDLMLQLLQQPIASPNTTLRHFQIVNRTNGWHSLAKFQTNYDYSDCNQPLLQMIGTNPSLTSMELLFGFVNSSSNDERNQQQPPQQQPNSWKGIHYDALAMGLGMNRVHQILYNDEDEEEQDDGIPSAKTAMTGTTITSEKIILALPSVNDNVSCLYKVLQLHNEICCNLPSSTSTTTAAATTTNGGGDDGSSNAVKESVLATTTGNSQKRKQRNWG